MFYMKYKASKFGGWSVLELYVLFIQSINLKFAISHNVSFEVKNKCLVWLLNNSLFGLID